MVDLPLLKMSYDDDRQNNNDIKKTTKHCIN